MKKDDLSISPVEFYQFRVRDYADGNLITKLKDISRLVVDHTIANCTIMASAKQEANGGPGIPTTIYNPAGHKVSNYKKILHEFNRVKVSFGGAQMVHFRLAELMVIIPVLPSKGYWPVYEED